MTEAANMEMKCPHCGRRQRKRMFFAVPVAVVDCRCGTTATVKPIRHDREKAFWSVEWVREAASQAKRIEQP